MLFSPCSPAHQRHARLAREQRDTLGGGELGALYTVTKKPPLARSAAGGLRGKKRLGDLRHGLPLEMDSL